ncbi:hypothetical protein ACH5RR_021277 [Cinchona calisaya]|uniref:Late blight resistance protein R1A-like N-terminal domain-containing protein n=1 Tax=Cinchona calisaya TaxID=153742 RepID=A0ABD2ZLU1_9GENT
MKMNPCLNICAKGSMNFEKISSFLVKKSVNFTLVSRISHCSIPVVVSSRSSYGIVRDEFMEFFDCLLENLVNFVIWVEEYCHGFRERLQPLEEKLRFLKIFIRFAELGGVEHSQLEKLLIQCEVVAVIAAKLCHLFWFGRSDLGVVIKFPEKIKLVDPLVCEIYIQVLMASNLSESSQNLAMEHPDKCIILGNFVDSLLGCLWEVQDYADIFTVSVKYQVQMLYEGLKFLKNILK